MYTTLQRQALVRVEESYKIAEKHYDCAFTRVPVNFSNKQTRTAGTAHYTRNLFQHRITPTEIRLSTQLLSLNGQTFIDGVCGHEAAHLISVELYGLGAEGHGHHWKEVMRVLGQSPDRLHTMDVPAGNRVRYVASCGKEVMLSKQKHNKLQTIPEYYLTLRRTGGRINAEHYAPLATPSPEPKLAVVALTEKPTGIVTLQPTMAIKDPIVTHTFKGQASSKSGQVREYMTKLRGDGWNKQMANERINWLTDYAESLGFNTRPAARSCVVSNIARIFVS